MNSSPDRVDVEMGHLSRRTSMTKSHALSFVVGFVCGGAALLVGLTVAPGSLPRRADAASSEAPRVNSPSAESIAAAVVREVEKRTTSGGAARENSLRSDIQTVQSQIELYRVQHEDKYPGMDDQGRFDGALLAAQLTSRTSGKGAVYSGGGELRAYPFGPYLAKMPANPFLSDPVASKVSGGRGKCPQDGRSGWWFDTDSRRFTANHAGQSGS
jgi:general secretion pathway protein G